MQILQVIKDLFNSNSDYYMPEVRAKYYGMDKEMHGESLKKGVVMRYDGHRDHGGLADRLLGLVDIYEVAKKMDIPFYVYHPYPMPLTTWLLPNKCDWAIEEQEIASNIKEAGPYRMLGTMQDPLRLVARLTLRRGRKKQIHIYCSHKPDKKTFSRSFFELFRFSPMLQSEIDAITGQLFDGKPYVALSFRFNQLLGDFKDTIGQPLSEEDQCRLMKKCCDEIRKLKQSEFADKQVLITADSAKFLAYAQADLDFVSIIPGKPVHISYDKDCALGAYTKIFIDLLMLSRAERIFLLVTDKLFQGRFAELASFIGNKEYRVHRF